MGTVKRAVTGISPAIVSGHDRQTKCRLQIQTQVSTMTHKKKT